MGKAFWPKCGKLWRVTTAFGPPLIVILLLLEPDHSRSQSNHGNCRSPTLFFAMDISCISPLGHSQPDSVQLHSWKRVVWPLQGCRIPISPGFISCIVSCCRFSGLYQPLWANVHCMKAIDGYVYGCDVVSPFLHAVLVGRLSSSSKTWSSNLT